MLLTALLLLSACCIQVIIRAAQPKCSLQQSWLLSIQCHALCTCLQFQATASALTAAIFSLNPRFSQLAVCFVTRLASLDFGCSILTTVFGGQQLFFKNACLASPACKELAFALPV